MEKSTLQNACQDHYKYLEAINPQTPSTKLDGKYSERVQLPTKTD